MQIRSTNGWLQNSHRDGSYNTGNVVNNIVVTRYGARWVLETSRGRHFVKYMGVYSNPYAIYLKTIKMISNVNWN